MPLIEEPEDAEEDEATAAGLSDDDSSNDEEVQPPSDVDEEVPEAVYAWGVASIPKC